MPLLSVPGADLNYAHTTGAGAPIVFAHGLLWRHEVFAAQLAEFSDRRCIAYDLRGHGRSSATGSGPISVESHYDDASALIDKLTSGPVHFVGAGLGGWVGLRLAARRPDRIASLCLLGTAHEPRANTARSKYWWLHIASRWLSSKFLADRALPWLVGTTFRTASRHSGALAECRALLQSQPPSVHRSVAGALRRPGLGHELAAIQAPVCLALGEEDAAVDPARIEALHRALPQSRLVRIPSAGHTMSIEAPLAVNAALRSFLERRPQPAPAVDSPAS